MAGIFSLPLRSLLLYIIYISNPQAMPVESLTLEQQLTQYPLFNQLTAQAQAQLLSELQKQQQALSQGIQLITLPTLGSPGTATGSSPSPDSQSQTTASISVNSVSVWTSAQQLKVNSHSFIR